MVENRPVRARGATDRAMPTALRATSMATGLVAAVAFVLIGCPKVAPPPSRTCAFDNGRTLGVGESDTTADGCNRCICTTDLTLDCTDFDRTDAGTHGVPDAGPDVDAGDVDAGVVEEPCHDRDGDGF